MPQVGHIQQRLVYGLFNLSREPRIIFFGERPNKSANCNLPTYILKVHGRPQTVIVSVSSVESEIHASPSAVEGCPAALEIVLKEDT